MTRVAVLTRCQAAVVAELAADGASNDEIADRLGLNVMTVKTHMWRALKAAGQPSRTALAVALLRGTVKIRVVNYPSLHLNDAA